METSSIPYDKNTLSVRKNYRFCWTVLRHVFCYSAHGPFYNAEKDLDSEKKTAQKNECNENENVDADTRGGTRMRNGYVRRSLKVASAV